MKSIFRIVMAVGLGVVACILGVGLIQSIIDGFLFYYIVDKGTLDGMFNRIFSSIPGVIVPPQKPTNSDSQSSIPGVVVPPKE